MSVNMPSTIRKMNKEIVLNTIREEGPLTRAQISKESGITKATVSEIVTELIEEQLVTDEKADDDTSRRGTKLSFAKDSFYGIAVDLGGTKINICLFNLEAEILAQFHTPTYKTDSSEAFIDSLTEDIEAFIAEKQVTKEKMKVISIATPGIVDYKAGVVLEGSPNLPEWSNLHLKEMLYKRTGIEIVIENDIRAALIGELYKEEAQTSSSAVLIGLGTGAGSALFMDGKIIRGANNAAGEVGYMLFNREQLYAPTDKGYFEILCAGSGIEESYHKLKGEKVTPEAIFKLASQGDLTAKYIVDKFSDYLAIGILNINAVINPEKVLLMGGVTKSAGLFLEDVNQKIANQTFSNTKVQVELSSLKEQAPLYGAAVLGLSTVFPSINFIKDAQLY